MDLYTNTYDVQLPLFRIGQNDKIIYYILIINKPLGSVLSFRKRYSDLRELHEKLEKKIKEYRLDLYLPFFPCRHIIHKTKSLNQIESRKNELQLYFKELLRIVKLHSLDLIKEYLPSERKQLIHKKRNSVQISYESFEVQNSFFQSKFSHKEEIQAP